MPARLAKRPSAAPSATRPIITLTTDFGLADSYVAATKAVLIRHCPQARLIDITHHVPRHDILCGSITLERAIDGFPPGTTHLAVIDPGVGTDRRLIVARINGQAIVCPDNGLITWSLRLHSSSDRADIYEITWRPPEFSSTFHGRDILAPVAAMLASGQEISTLGRSIHDPILLDLAPAGVRETKGRVIHIDHFGNATTNIRQIAVAGKPQLKVRVNRKLIGPLKRTYWDVPPGKPLALIGSAGLLEIAVRDGSAKDDLNIHVGDDVVLT